ncbi:type II toxin-antitoxin system VapB family antitoxin [Bosea sp. NPDC003192]|jgi:hypothetical protein|uniref:type II toxin-antitoxin system VapB family antitoxin n=1 Tax=Bosea sp. NPDC003192 TaxID=3390551 RepID=UPI003D048321
MGILVRDEKIDRQVRELAKISGTTLQGAIGIAVENELKRREERRERIEEAFRRAHAYLAQHPVIDDGMTHKEFWDRESGDA